MVHRVRYEEGSWFAVPLPSGGFAVGVVARGKKGFLVAYLFGPRRLSIPAVAQLAPSVANAADIVVRVGDAAIVDGVWPVLGCLSGWRREEWPIPAFGRVEPLRGHGYRVEYASDDPIEVIRETRVLKAEADALPDNGVPGHALLARMLDRLLE